MHLVNIWTRLTWVSSPMPWITRLLHGFKTSQSSCWTSSRVIFPLVRRPTLYIIVKTRHLLELNPNSILSVDVLYGSFLEWRREPGLKKTDTFTNCKQVRKSFIIPWKDLTWEDADCCWLYTTVFY